MFSAAMHLLHIKDLKDLSVFSVWVTIDIQDLKDLKRCFHVNVRGGQAPARRAKEGVLLAMRPFGIRRSRTTVSGARERSRGTGPRATN